VPENSQFRELEILSSKLLCTDYLTIEKSCLLQKEKLEYILNIKAYLIF
jgi:hypothetical protein